MHRGLDFDLLAAADARIQGLPELRNTEGFVVLHRGEVAFERYYRGRLPDDLADTHSVTKLHVGGRRRAGEQRDARPRHAGGVAPAWRCHV
jgi:hypothetical protein